MDVAIFSDIHGNAVALDAVLADLANRTIDAMVCLGDALQGGAQPQLVAERLAELGCPVVLGNADHFLLEPEGAFETVTEAHLEVREWTLEQIGTPGVELIRTFVPTYELALDGDTLLCFHGSPRSFDDVLLPETPQAEVEAALADAPADVLTGGHTHLQWVRPLGPRTFFNPGSVGLAYHRYAPRESFSFHPFAQYAIVHSGAGSVAVEMCQAPFDPDDVARAAEAGGHPSARRA